jgi:hypothetical protein
MAGGPGYGAGRVAVNVTEQEFLKSEEKRLNDGLQDIRSRLSALEANQKA